MLHAGDTQYRKIKRPRRSCMTETELAEDAQLL
jgi:hypothetical protein